MKLKKWYTLADASKRLSLEFTEDVSTLDILQLALEGEINLSIHLGDFPALKVDEIRAIETGTVLVQIDELQLPASISDPVLSVGTEKLFLSGIFHLDTKFQCISTLLKNTILGKPASNAKGGFWLVSDIHNSENVYVAADIDADFEFIPNYNGPKLEDVVIIKEDIEQFIYNSFASEEEQVSDYESTNQKEIRRINEVMGALIEAYYENKPPRYKKSNNMPNISTITEDILVKAQGSSGRLGKSKVNNLLSAAWKTWAAIKG
ncbi:hypothetical protein [Litchfieldella xinjiangensis]|uniref:hypothetical protein n=1 Tax=Litchfieldella xinjiangensis TaxID=1166948 RepID=UPI0005B9837A|nr:hypothetical protein [Halomonas xinjiangensis]